jgi:hypothetical protein
MANATSISLAIRTLITLRRQELSRCQLRHGVVLDRPRLPPHGWVEEE